MSRSLQADGVHVMEPDVGPMACGEFGPGRLPEPERIAAQIRTHAGRARAASARSPASALSSPPARRASRSIRCASSPIIRPASRAMRSPKPSRRLGADVRLVTGPTQLADSRRRHGREGRDGHRDARRGEGQSARRHLRLASPPSPTGGPRRARARKLKLKGGEQDSVALQLVENPDILKSIGTRKKDRPRLVVGFAAETNDVEKHAKAKLARKGCDWIVANDVSGDVMGGADNEVLLVIEGRHGTLAAHEQGATSPCSWPSASPTPSTTRKPARRNSAGGGYGLARRQILGHVHDPPHRLLHPERPARGAGHHRRICKRLGTIPGSTLFEVTQNRKADLFGNEIDVVVYAEFPDIDALHAYKKHPTYMDVTNTVRPRRELRFAADVEA